VIRTVAVIALAAAALAPMSAAAQDAAVPPRFFIERIEIRNTTRVSPVVVAAESRLREGSEYTEAELRDAAARLTRLPFLLNVDFALERGSERGRHVLVITVTETRSFFYRLDIVPVVEQGPTTQIEIGSPLPDNDTSAALGYRWFLGRRGALHVALIGRDSTELTRGYGAFAVGWTQYDLFGTRAFATINIKDSPELGISPQLVIGVPLSLNQTFTAEYDELVVDYDVSYAIKEAFDERDTQRLARLTWSYNTTNHPFLPTEGTLFSAGPVIAWRDESSFLFVVGDPDGDQIIQSVVHTRIVGVEGTARRYWEITDRDSVSLGVTTRLANFDQRYNILDGQETHSYNTLSGVAVGGFSRSLWSPERRAQGGDSRIEFNLSARVRGRSSAEPERLFRTNDRVAQISGSWVRHSSWGTFRIGLGIAW
jgi:outer membrane protein assembly factor BamA